MRIAVSKISKTFCSSASRAVTLKLDEDKKVARISLTNPKKRNTLSLEAINLLKSSFSEVEQKVKDKKTKVRGP